MAKFCLIQKTLYQSLSRVATTIIIILGNPSQLRKVWDAAMWLPRWPTGWSGTCRFSYNLDVCNQVGVVGAVPGLLVVFLGHDLLFLLILIFYLSLLRSFFFKCWIIPPAHPPIAAVLRSTLLPYMHVALYACGIICISSCWSWGHHRGTLYALLWRLLLD